MSNELETPTIYNVTDETLAAAKKALNELGFPDKDPVKKTVELMLATAALLASNAGSVPMVAEVADIVHDILHEIAKDAIAEERKAKR